MRKKILAFILVLCLIMPCMVLFSACDTSTVEDVKVRVENGQVQWSNDDETWIDLISVEQLKEQLGDSIQGANGEDGQDGRDVEFRKTDTHIQWRYKTADNSDTWKNIVSIDELMESANAIQGVTVYNVAEGFEKFQEAIYNMNSYSANWKITKSFKDRTEYESYRRLTVAPLEMSSSMSSYWCLKEELKQTYKDTPNNYSIATMEVDGKRICPYELKVVPYVNGPYAPIRMYSGYYQLEGDPYMPTYNYISGAKDYPWSVGGIGNNMYNSLYTSKFSFVDNLEFFTQDEIVDCYINNDGNIMITFEHTLNHSGTHLYEFYMSLDNDDRINIEQCLMYEKNILTGKKGALYCNVTYQKGASDIDSDMVHDFLIAMNDQYASELGDEDFFGYVDTTA